VLDTLPYRDPHRLILAGLAGKCFHYCSFANPWLTGEKQHLAVSLASLRQHSV
jgi:hypothetical protein